MEKPLQGSSALLSHLGFALAASHGTRYDRLFLPKRHTDFTLFNSWHPVAGSSHKLGTRFLKLAPIIKPGAQAAPAHVISPFINVDRHSLCNPDSLYLDGGVSHELSTFVSGLDS